MTCIVGYLDKQDDCVWIGCDSLGSNGYTKSVNAIPKAFRNVNLKNVVMGSTTSFRNIDLLMYAEDLLPEIDWYKRTEIDHKYMVTKFIPNLITLFQDGVKDQPDTDRGANFIVGVGNKLFEIQNDYSVLEPSSGFCAVGCGETVAMGSLLTTCGMDMPVVDKIVLGLEASEKYTCGVQRPFRLINTKTEEEKIIS